MQSMRRALMHRNTAITNFRSYNITFDFSILKSFYAPLGCHNVSFFHGKFRRMKKIKMSNSTIINSTNHENWSINDLFETDTLTIPSHLGLSVWRIYHFNAPAHSLSLQIEENNWMILHVALLRVGGWSRVTYQSSFNCPAINSCN